MELCDGHTIHPFSGVTLLIIIISDNFTLVKGTRWFVTSKFCYPNLFESFNGFNGYYRPFKSEKSLVDWPPPARRWFTNRDFCVQKKATTKLSEMKIGVLLNIKRKVAKSKIKKAVNRILFYIKLSWVLLIL